ncbi:MAG TPA: MBL fold metallo-hydrolase [Bryobacteraceae bacterium]|jgi:ribonuclease BN (tRNA processing enzyme)|nr:MBL fold metallo-hydrolase [Bryobacteraceae bacterium]
MLLIAAQVILLGTGTPNADPERAGPSVAVIAGGVPYLVDFGPGVVRRAAAAHIKPSDLKIAFATHLHSDHTTGLADLIFTPWTLERAVPLELYGPRGIRSMASHIESAYAEDIHVRLTGGEPSNKTGYRVKAHEIRPGVVYRDANVTVTAFLVPHGEWKEAFGYRFDTADGRSVVISGDTGPTDVVAKACNGCDVLIHEVYSVEGFKKRPVEWQRYHARYHTSSEELAGIATKARPGVLVLTHLLFWGTSEEELLGEVRRGYAGKVVSGRDLDVF